MVQRTKRLNSMLVGAIVALIAICGVRANAQVNSPPNSQPNPYRATDN
jgi:hypothetical protein